MMETLGFFLIVVIVVGLMLGIYATLRMLGFEDR